MSRCNLCVSLDPVKLTQLPTDQQSTDEAPPHTPESAPQHAPTATPPSCTEKKRPPVKQVAAMSVKSYVEKGECEWVGAAAPAIPLEQGVSERDVTELREEFADVFENKTASPHPEATSTLTCGFGLVPTRRRKSGTSSAPPSGLSLT